MIISRVDNHFKVSLSLEFLDNNLKEEKRNTFQITQNPLLLQQLQLSIVQQNFKILQVSSTDQKKTKVH